MTFLLQIKSVWKRKEKRTAKHRNYKVKMLPQPTTTQGQDFSLIKLPWFSICNSLSSRVLKYVFFFSIFTQMFCCFLRIWFGIMFLTLSFQKNPNYINMFRLLQIIARMNALNLLSSVGYFSVYAYELMFPPTHL